MDTKIKACQGQKKILCWVVFQSPPIARMTLYLMTTDNGGNTKLLNAQYPYPSRGHFHFILYRLSCDRFYQQISAGCCHNRWYHRKYTICCSILEMQEKGHCDSHLFRSTCYRRFGNINLWCMVMDCLWNIGKDEWLFLYRTCLFTVAQCDLSNISLPTSSVFLYLLIPHCAVFS